MTKRKVMEMLLLTLNDKPQSRRRLCKVIGTNDRTLRMAVKELRKRGVPVCSNSQTSGYWLGKDKDLDHLVADYECRAYDLLETARAIKKYKGRSDQIEWTQVLQ